MNQENNIERHGDKQFCLLVQLFENPRLDLRGDCLGYIVRDIINMNWWNTSGIIIGYGDGARISSPFSETQKRIAVQLKEFYRVKRTKLKDEVKFRNEIRNYLTSKSSRLEQLSIYSMQTRANPSQYFERDDGSMTWVDCTSRATYAAKYVFQNGYIDFDGKCRVLGANEIVDCIQNRECEDLGVAEYFVEGENSVKADCFSQKNNQRSVEDWINLLDISIIPERRWLYDLIKHVRTDPFKNFEAEQVRLGLAKGVNECLYGFKTSASHASRASNASNASSTSHASRASNASNASDASRASDASHASRASNASEASHASNASNASAASDASHASAASDASRSRASRASNASYASRASRASHASDASNASAASHASHASDAGSTGFQGESWNECETAIARPKHLRYPKVFRANIFAIAGNWKIDAEIVGLAKLGWFDPFCVDADTEYLSPHGWKKIKEYSGEKVAQYLPSGEIEFVKPLQYIAEKTDEEFIEFNNRSLSICGTLGHGIAYYNLNKAGMPLEKKPLEDFYLARHRRGVNQNKRIPISYAYHPKNPFEISEARLRLEVAIQADAHLRRRKPSDGEWEVIFSLRKVRKISRLKDLLLSNAIQSNESSYIRADGKQDTRIQFKFKSVFQTTEKTFPIDFIHLSADLRRVFCEEVMQWDGCAASNIYSTNNKTNADIVQLMFASCGFSSQIALAGRNYRVQRSLQTTASMTSHERGVFVEKFYIVRPGAKFCFTVPSGAWLMKRNGKICATGNSGHGTSPLYAKRHGIKYLGFDTNQCMFEKFLNIVNEECQGTSPSVEVRCADSTIFVPELTDSFDLCYTSPPYFNFEEYGGNREHFEDCETYNHFHNKITIPIFRNVRSYLIPGGTLALQLEKDERSVKRWKQVITHLGFKFISSGLTGQEKDKYSSRSKRDQFLLVFSNQK